MVGGSFKHLKEKSHRSNRLVNLDEIQLLNKKNIKSTKLIVKTSKKVRDGPVTR